MQWTHCVNNGRSGTLHHESYDFVLIYGNGNIHYVFCVLWDSGVMFYGTVYQLFSALRVYAKEETKPCDLVSVILSMVHN